MNEVYYKIQVAQEGLIVICLQDSDEKDYPKYKWLSEYKFKEEKDAEQMIQSIYSFIGRYVICT